MKKLITGLREFKSSYVSTHRDLLEKLSHGQKPRVLFITCSDSRIAPNLVTQADLGELFVIRNAGNIIPPYGAANGGEGAAVEYAIHALGIEQIIVCGHSHCGAMKGLLHLNDLQADMPLVYDWLKHAEATRRLVKENYSGYTDEELMEIAIAENVLTQIENLRTYPVVHSKIYQGKLHIYGWIYHIETGEVLAYDPGTHSYVPPQTQLADEHYSVGPYKSTSAPPITCDLPLVPADEVAAPSGKEPVHPGKEPVHPDRNLVAAHVGKDPVTNYKDNGQVQELSAAPWLSAEQAERIYRGSKVRK